MKSLLTRQLLACFIISSMLLQFVVSATDFHLHTLSDTTHSHVHQESDVDIVEIMHSNGTSKFCEVLSQPTISTDLYDHHCCHSVSTSIVLSVIATPLLPKQSTSTALYFVDFYTSPVSDALIRPPIT
jgi:hypothetical protein